MGDAFPLPPGYRRHHLETVGSTNSVAMDLARAGEAGRLWVTADRQTGGRGRRGRQWVSEPGNLYSSVLVRDPGPVERLAELPLVAAVALARALEAACDAEGRIALKWPNDLIVDGAKISGILAESAFLGDGRLVAVIGIGVNVAHHPDLPGYKTTSLATLGWPADVERVFAFLADAFADRLAAWNGGSGFAAIREDWLSRAWKLGEAVDIRQGDSIRSGRFVTLDAAGRIVLEGADGSRETFSAGDVAAPASDGDAREFGNSERKEV